MHPTIGIDGLMRLSRDRLRRRQARLSDGRMSQVCAAIEFAVGCDAV